MTKIHPNKQDKLYLKIKILQYIKDHKIHYKIQHLIIQ